MRFGDFDVLKNTTVVKSHNNIPKIFYAGFVKCSECTFEVECDLS